MESTVTFDEEVKGWTSFFSYLPEFMTGLNGKFFSLRNGDLWQHNSKNVPRNNFYGEQFTSKVSLVLNDDPSVEKTFQNIFLEGNKTWAINLNSNLAEGSIYRSEFQKKKSRFFAYTRRNEDAKDISSFGTYGIGNTTDIIGSTIFFRNINDMVCIGDKLTQMQSGIPIELGVIENIDRLTGEVTLSSLENQAALNEFCYATKYARVEGGNIRGYYCRVDLENDDTDFTELFAVNSNATESYV